MNINILKEFKLFFIYKKLINIIFNCIYVNYTYKITLICVFFHILSFFESSVSMNFESIRSIDIFIKLSTNISLIFMIYP